MMSFWCEREKTDQIICMSCYCLGGGNYDWNLYYLVIEVLILYYEPAIPELKLLGETHVLAHISFYYQSSMLNNNFDSLYGNYF